MSRGSLADAVTGRRVRITSVELEGEASAWISAVGLHEGAELVVLRRAALGGPLHVRSGGGGEFAVAREVAAMIMVSEASALSAASSTSEVGEANAADEATR